MQVQVWICPVEGCSEYYGSSASHNVDLSKEMTYRSSMDGGRALPPTGNRAQCPTHKHVNRVRVTLDAPKPSMVEAEVATA